MSQTVEPPLRIPFRIDLPLADGLSIVAYRTTGGSVSIAINRGGHCVIRLLLTECAELGASRFNILFIDGDPDHASNSARAASSLPPAVDTDTVRDRRP